MTPAERLIDRLRTMGVPVPDGTVLRRTYAGSDQRSKGAWSWYLDPPGVVPGMPVIAGYRPVRELLRERLMITLSDIGDWEVDPWAVLSPPNQHTVRFEEKS